MNSIENRSTRIFIRILPHEKMQYEQYCQEAGLTQSDYFRVKCLGTKPLRKRRSPSVDTKMLCQALAELGRIGGNINQIAKRYNSGFAPATENLESIRQDLQTMRTLIREALGTKTG